MRLYREPPQALSRIELVYCPTWLMCHFCGNDPRGLEVRLGHKPGPRDKFLLCFRCASQLVATTGPKGHGGCQACGSTVHPGAVLQRNDTVIWVQKRVVRVCWGCSAKLIALLGSEDLRKGAITSLEWEGRVTP